MLNIHDIEIEMKHFQPDHQNAIFDTKRYFYPSIPFLNFSTKTSGHDEVNQRRRLGEVTPINRDDTS